MNEQFSGKIRYVYMLICKHTFQKLHLNKHFKTSSVVRHSELRLLFTVYEILWLFQICQESNMFSRNNVEYLYKRHNFRTARKFHINWLNFAITYCSLLLIY